MHTNAPKQLKAKGKMKTTGNAPYESQLQNKVPPKTTSSKYNDLQELPDTKVAHSLASTQRMESGLPTPRRNCTLLHPNKSSSLEGCKKTPQAQSSSLKPGHQVEGRFHSAAQGGRSHPSSPPLAQVIGPAARSPEPGAGLGLQRYPARSL